MSHRRFLRSIVGCMPVLSLAASCGESPTGADRDSGSDAASDAIEASDDAPDASNDALDSGTDATEAGSDASDSGDAATPDVLAGDCTACGPYEMCKDPSGKCGTGSCQPRTFMCYGGGPRVCGCDGVQYPSSCLAGQAGVDVDVDPAACAAPSPTLFTCGKSFCVRGLEYCEGWYGDASDAGLLCRPKPSTCSALDCACAKAAPCSIPSSFKGVACTDDGKGDVFVTCVF